VIKLPHSHCPEHALHAVDSFSIYWNNSSRKPASVLPEALLLHDLSENPFGNRKQTLSGSLRKQFAASAIGDKLSGKLWPADCKRA
jgi:hypothetical protein